MLLGWHALCSEIKKKKSSLLRVVHMCLHRVDRAVSGTGGEITFAWAASTKAQLLYSLHTSRCAVHGDVKKQADPMSSVLPPYTEFLWLTCLLIICSFLLISAPVTHFFLYFSHFNLYAHTSIKTYFFYTNPDFHSSALSELLCFSGIW